MNWLWLFVAIDLGVAGVLAILGFAGTQNWFYDGVAWEQRNKHWLTVVIVAMLVAAYVMMLFLP